VIDYSLPPELIAQHPSEPRDAARLLVLDRKTGTVSHKIFRDLPEFLRPGDCLVLNDTRVIPARLFGKKAVTGGQVELLLIAPVESSERAVVYRCIGQPARNLKVGMRLTFADGVLQAEVIEWREGERLVRFEGRDAQQILRRIGQIPLPPYIDRAPVAQDSEQYQTVYAREEGAVAAPTAGLHFTPQLLEKINAAGVKVAYLTLHVGWGTFKPVGEKEKATGKLHAEQFSIPEETIEAIRQTKKSGGRVIAVGTTVVRALETAALRHAQGERVRVEDGQITELFIQPGFEFRIVDAMITNFHLPGTSLLLLVSAFAGEENIQKAYAEAVAQRYRFYSYGDAMFIAQELPRPALS
jgi:S-adenosylmethionine:tRNA ribosyltransferase-isomerase